MCRKILFIILLPLIAEVLMACCKCDATIVSYYTHTKISVLNLDNSGASASVTSASSVLKTAYGIRLKLFREQTACLNPQKTFFISTAQAFKCDCGVDSLLLRDSITAIKVFTMYDFDNNHLANADVSDYFKVYKPYSFSKIADYLKSSKEVQFYIEKFLEVDIDLLLMNPPALNTQHKFKVQVTFSDGRILVQETPAIDLIL